LGLAQQTNELFRLTQVQLIATSGTPIGVTRKACTARPGHLQVLAEPPARSKRKKEHGVKTIVDTASERHGAIAKSPGFRPIDTSNKISSWRVDYIASGNKRRFCILLLVSSLACVTLPPNARARTAFDGDWSVLLSTGNGACVPSYRFGVQIFEGAIIYQNAGVSLQGRVTPKGAVRVTVQSDGQSASGQGHLSMMRGGGVWRGQSTSGTCSGTWVAERH
jgi:hypothetical protein